MYNVFVIKRSYRNLRKCRKMLKIKDKKRDREILSVPKKKRMRSPVFALDPGFSTGLVCSLGLDRNFCRWIPVQQKPVFLFVERP